MARKKFVDVAAVLAHLDLVADRYSAAAEEVEPGLWVGSSPLDRREIADAAGLPRNSKLGDPERDSWLDLLGESELPSDHVFHYSEPDGDHTYTLVNCDMPSQSYSIAALKLPTKRRLYVECCGSGDGTILGLGTVRRHDHRLLTRIAGDLQGNGSVWTSGGDLKSIDLLISMAEAPSSSYLGQIWDDEAAFLEWSSVEERRRRSGELEKSLEEAIEAGEMTPEEAEADLNAPAWFLDMTDSQLDAVATLQAPLPRDALANNFEPWQRPTPLIIQTSVQHLVASFYVWSN